MSGKLKFWIISFIEGGTVMLAELCAVKLLAPYFGTSIQVWASTLAVTLGGLAVGYLLGAHISKFSHKNNNQYLKFILFVSGIYLIAVPLFSHKLLPLFLSLPLAAGSMIGLMIILFPTLVLLGSTSPVIINLLNIDQTHPGKTAGTVYSVSTIGGILFTLVTGFYFLPSLGIKFSMIFGGLLISISSLLLPDFNKKSEVKMIILLIITSFFSISFKPHYNEKFKVLHESDGLLGNIKVIEHSAEYLGDKNLTGRGLVVNNTLQSFMDINDPNHSSIWAWSNIIPATLSIYPPKKTRALLCGLGGATIVKQLQQLGFEFEVVEIDQRVHDLAKKYFYLGNSVKVTIDDARHFVRNTKEKYDIVIFDTFLSESAPEHLLTIEALKEVQQILKPGGMLLTNFYGFTSGDLGYAARSVMKTYLNAGFKVYPIATPGNEDGRNLLIIGTNDDKDFSKVSYEESDGMKITDLSGLIIPSKAIDLKQAEVLVDNQPKLAKLYSKPSQMWKKGYNNIYTKNLFK